MTTRAKSVVLAALFTGILLVATFVLLEVVLRAAQYATAGTPPTKILLEYRERRFPLSSFLVFGPRIDWQIPNKPNPEHAYFNRQGFRTRDALGPKPASELRVIAIGGSTTEDVWTEDGLHWPLWAERELHRLGVTHARVYNTGMSSYSSAHTLVRLAFDVLEYEPDIVLVMDNINDLTVNYEAAVAGAPVDSHYLVKYGGKRHTGDVDESDVVLSRVAHSIRARVSASTSDVTVPADYDIERGLGYFRRNLRSIEALVAARGTKLALLTMPVCESEQVYRTVEVHGRRRLSSPLPGDFARFMRDFQTYNEAIRAAAGDGGAVLIDMARLFGGDPRYFSDFVHYNAAGSRRFGEVVAGHLATMLRRESAGRELTDGGR